MQTQKGGLTYCWILGGSYIRFMTSIPLSPARVAIRINVKRATENRFTRWCTWQDNVRTFFENFEEETENVEIPEYSIPTLLQPTVTQSQQAIIPITLT